MTQYRPPSQAEVDVLWNQQAGGRREIRRVLVGRNLRRALSSRCSGEELQDILRAIVDDLYPVDKETTMMRGAAFFAARNT